MPLGINIQAGMLSGGAGIPAVLTYVGGTNTGTNSSGYTFSSHAIGTASADRHVIVCVYGNKSAIPTVTVTVGGASCTESVSLGTSASDDYLGIFITDAPVTTGTTADIVVNLSLSMNCLGIMVFNATGLQSTTPDSTASNNSSDGSITATIPDGGFYLVASSNDNTNNMTWTNATERDGFKVGDQNVRMECADTTTSATITRSVTTNDFPITVGVAMR